MNKTSGKECAADHEDECLNDDVDTASFAKALLFLALGFGISWCAVGYWGPNQMMTLLSGVFGLLMGAIYLTRYFSVKNDSKLAYAAYESHR